MRQPLLKIITLLPLLILVAGCASTPANVQNKESMLIAAGFKTITPKTAAQQQKLQKLPPDKVTMIHKKGKNYYIFPDPAQNRAFVGGPKQYQAYQQIRADKKLAQENLETAEMYNDAAMQWSLWGGWGAGEGVWGPMAGPGTF